jgi:MORN repeat
MRKIFRSLASTLVLAFAWFTSALATASTSAQAVTILGSTTNPSGLDGLVVDGPGTTNMRSLALIVVTLLLLPHPSIVAYSQGAQDDDEIISSGTEVPLVDCRPARVASRSWAVTTGEVALSGTAIEHTHLVSTEEAESLAICQPTVPKNNHLSVRFKVLNGARGGGGIAFRIATPEVYYLVKIDVLRNRAALHLLNNGTDEEIVAVDVDVAVNTWHMLAIRAQDDRFTVYLNGTWIFTGYDKTLADAGLIALWAEPSGTTLFDRLTVGPIPAPRIGPSGSPIGTYAFANGDQYVGEMNYGAMHGHGIYKFGNGDEYIGEFNRGHRTGKGTYTYFNGDTYVGEVIDGIHCGFGIYTFANGKKLVGEFKDGKFNGRD